MLLNVRSTADGSTATLSQTYGRRLAITIQTREVWTLVPDDLSRSPFQHLGQGAQPTGQCDGPEQSAIGNSAGAGGWHVAEEVVTASRTVP